VCSEPLLKHVWKTHTQRIFTGNGSPLTKVLSFLQELFLKDSSLGHLGSFSSPQMNSIKDFAALTLGG